MYELRYKVSGERIGLIDESQLQFLEDQMEEESTEDRDYYIDANTLDMFIERGIDPKLLAMLRGALGTRQGIDIAWSPLNATAD